MGCLRGGRPDDAGSPFHYGVENDRVVEKRALQVHGMGPDDGAMGWRGQRLDQTHDTDTTSQRRRCSEPTRINETGCGKGNGTQRNLAD